MVQAVRRGASRRTVARAQHVSLCTVQRWVQRATGQPLNRIEWEDRSHATRHPGRTAEALEVLVMSLRQELRATSALGDYGADAIHRTLLDRGARDVPVVRTIHRILERRGALDGTRRPAARSSIASTLSKAWASKGGHMWKCSPVFRCMGA